jgi:hypothetical protein
MPSNNLDGKLVKQANITQRFTEDDLDALAKCMNPDTGPHYFLENFFYIQHPTKGKVKYEPYEYQKKLIDSYHKHRFNINMLGRQLGKTTTASGYLLWYAMFIPDSTILIAAHKYGGALEIMSRIRYAYEMCPNFIKAGCKSYNKESIEFDNNSRIMSQTTTETTGRGLSLSLLYCDEFSYVPPHIASEFWASISPTLATGGKAIITSTPNSDEDQFAQIWKEANKKYDEFGNETEVGRNGFYAYSVKWNEHPERDKTWENAERSRIGEERFRREHNIEFLIFDETLISSIKLAQLEGIEPKMKMGQCRWYKKINPKNTYIVALDPSLGTGGDPAAIQIIELPSFEQVGEWYHNTTPIQGQVRILKDICNYIKSECDKKNSELSLYYSVENNAIGEAALIAINELGEDTIPGLFLSEPVKRGHVRKFRKGFNTTHTSKISACAKLKQLVENDKLKIYSKSLISELKTYVAKGLSFAGKSESNDDLVSSILLAIRMIMTLQDWDPVVYDKLKEEDNENWILPMPIYINSF